MATLAVFVVVIAGAGVGQSALGGSSQSGVLISGTTDSITNIDPAGNYDFGTFSLGANIFEHLYEAKNGAKVVPVAGDGLRTWRIDEDVALQSSARRRSSTTAPTSTRRTSSSRSTVSSTRRS